MTDEFPRAESADVALLLEGTFPYVSGGVSSWVNQMIRAFPDIRFALVFIGSRREDYGKPVYALPDNVVHVECHYLYDFPAPPLVQASGGDTRAFDRSRKLHDALRDPANHGETAELIRASIADLREDGPLAEEQFLYSHRAWEMMTDYYRRYCTDPSFTDYFWTVRIMHKPLWMLVRIAE
ncbi:GT4 family glycosyltransferase PelF, partial [Ralstonia pseudosolanacearum]